MIVDQDLLRLVKTNKMFNAIPESFLKTFIKPKNFLFVKEGTLIYSFDDESSDFYLIVEGEVKIKYCDQYNIERRYLHDFFGEREILDGSNRSSFVIADKDCTLYKIDAETFKDLVANNQTIAGNVNKLEKLESAEVAEVSSSI